MKLLNCFFMNFVFFVSILLISSCNVGSAFTVKPVEETNNGASLHSVTSADSEEDAKSQTLRLLGKCDPCRDAVACVPQIQCPAHVRMSEHEKPQTCDLPAGSGRGYCCVTGQNHTADDPTKFRERTAHVPSSFLPPNILDEAHLQFEKLVQHGGVRPVEPGLPDFLHNMVFHSTPQDDMQNFQLSHSAMEQVITSQVFTKKEEIPVDDIITNKIHVEFKHTPLAHHCAAPLRCPPPAAPYRSFDGTCNHPQAQRAHWGAAGQPMERVLPPAYEDGIWMPRTHARDGSPLTSAREVSRVLLTDADQPHPKYNLLLMQFGQFVSHDITQSATMRLENGNPIQCCTPDGSGVLPPAQQHFACMPIAIEPKDEFYGIFGQRCLNFVRLSLAPNTDCRMSYGKQRSQVTHYLDASTVYGSSVQKARRLRAFRGGRLRMLNDFGRDLLPLTNDKIACGNAELDKTCFESGDGRTNQVISLIIMHQLFAREHNRIADTLSRLNPSWSDELLFQEARRIVIAELQHIVYNEYLPAIVGREQMKRFRLLPRQHGFADDYNRDVNPAITNEFSGAAFRMGHSSVDGRLYADGGRQRNASGEIIDISETMFNPSRVRKRDFCDDMLRSSIAYPMQRVDGFISQGLTRYLFRGHNAFGLDLAAINVQRGRDHSLRPYNDYLELTGQRKLQSFSQLPTEVARKLAQVYRSADDVDLWIGGLLEKSVAGGCVGTTFAEIIADQFSRLKHGDRYFYEFKRNINPGAFSEQQLHEIRKASMARLICDNADNLTLHEMPPHAFVRADHSGNRALPCDAPQLPFVDLKAWRI